MLSAVDSFEGKLAVVTGGGSGIGRELVVQLAAAGCRVAACDLNVDTIGETAELARGAAPVGTAVTGHACDVADEAAVLRFRDEALEAHASESVDLVFANAGIGGGGSFIREPRETWERTFAVDWWGVYHTARAFLPLLIKSPEGVLVNTSSVNGFWATLGPGMPHTAYSTAKFAVKGFSEALVEDLRSHAPHVRVVLAMPGHVATNIVVNSARAHGASDAELRVLERFNAGFRDSAPLSAADAAAIILDGVRSGAWRVLVGEGARRLDEFVRANPERAYDYADMPAAVAPQTSRPPAG
jgi:NAD(P)-dependent dehydrogenase (short-subunit alcohol dehydrogenase family)